MPIRDITKNKDRNYDICIIGSGPAGLTLCNELADSNKKICLIESGGIKKNYHSDSLRKVENKGEIKIRESSRERIFGGTSTTWSGLSAPLDKIDFNGWPISFEELKPYYEKASVYGFPTLKDFDYSSINEIRSKADFILQSKNLDEKIFIAKDPPWDFGKQFSKISDRLNVDLYTNLTVTHITSSRRNSNQITIENVLVRDEDGNDYNIYAKTFIIAVGGIESIRLLLLSKDTYIEGLGNEHDQVGRYIMNHPKNNFGVIRLNKPIKDLAYLFGYLHSGWAKYAGIRVNEEMQKKLSILNSYVRFEPIFPWTDSEGVSELILIIKRFKYFLNWWKRKQKKLVNLRDWNETGDDGNHPSKFNLIKSILKVIIDLPSVFYYVIHRIFQNKKIPVKTIRIRNFMEMEPRSENRIILSNINFDKNQKELPQIILDTSKLDRHSLIELHRILGEEIKKNNIGILDSNLKNEKSWPITTEASHHLGGTRMGNSEIDSVVDKNLKMHSVNNLYICSGSVFPTSGCANPTYTICALAIRLANQLKTISS